jgi:hypothetical protein
MRLMEAAIIIVFLRPRLSMVNPPLVSVSTTCLSLRTLSLYINEPKKAPPEKVAFTAPIIGDASSVRKKSRKFGDWMTMVITPESYPKRKLPVPANMARAKLKKRPIVATSELRLGRIV